MTVTIPNQLSKRPRDHRGWPIPYTTLILPSGKPDFRSVTPRAWTMCVKRRLCGLCGQPIHRQHLAHFIGGPLAFASRHFADPAMHLDCATYAAQVCPFITMPKAHYADTERRPMPDGFASIGMAPDRPERFAVAGTPDWRVVIGPTGERLIKAEPWQHVTWWRDGKQLEVS